MNKVKQTLLLSLAFGLVLSGCETCKQHPTICAGLAWGVATSVILSCTRGHGRQGEEFPMSTGLKEPKVGNPSPPNCRLSPELCR